MLIETSMMWKLMELLWLAAQAPDFSTSFREALLPLLGLGFFLGLLTTGFAYAYYDTTRSKR